ncbi:uncharacterized protein LOC131247297 [Magnolia sinica]|uniref:uncharacterized protein LOC131247297 n=1 Tax=Magnolia sinica TaxID=86752 RepID=UPI00265ADD2D|nr:uncharacterized protein LOC131247297 [Magnolia sinica]
MEETEPPFNSEIMGVAMPPRFRMPPIIQYWNSGDLTEHMESYRSWMRFQLALEAMMCRAFSITLTGDMRSWYQQLKPKSISTFVELRKNPPTKNLPTTLGELISQAQKYSNAEEFFRSRKNNQGSEYSSKEKKRKDKAPSQANKRKSEESISRDRRPSRRLERKFNSYTPLNTSSEQILLDIWDKRLLYWPSCLKTKAGQLDKRRYCCFHRDHGHNTNDCVNLKEEIETLIHKGHLRQYVKEEKQPRKNESSSRAANDAVNIQTIYGGPSGGGDSNQARKAHARSTNLKHYIHLVDRLSKEPRMSPCSLTFTEDDARGIQHPHDDALVVTMTVANRKCIEFWLIQEARPTSCILKHLTRWGSIGQASDPFGPHYTALLVIR